MTEQHDDERPARPRRPPAAPMRWATVTRLGAGGQTEEMPPASALPPVDGSLALKPPAVTQPLTGLPQTPELRVVHGTGTGEAVQVWAARFAQAVVEVLGGDRPLSQLVRWTSQRVYAELDSRLTILARTSPPGRRPRTVRPQVRSVHVFHPTPECAEVSVHVRHGQRSRAIAARLELVRGRWQCTVLQLG